MTLKQEYRKALKDGLTTKNYKDWLEEVNKNLDKTIKLLKKMGV